jgi:hypothetical protein
MVIGKQIISFNDNLYELVKTFQDKEGFPTTEFKEHYECDTLLKKEGILYFCNLIQEAQIIEDNEQIQLVEEKQEESTTPEEERTEG